MKRAAPSHGVDFVLEPVSENCWRACDDHALRGEAGRLIAYVQLRGSQYEVTQIGKTFRWSLFPTLREALASIRIDAARDLTARSLGEFAFLR